MAVPVRENNGRRTRDVVTQQGMFVRVFSHDGRLAKDFDVTDEDMGRRTRGVEPGRIETQHPPDSADHHIPFSTCKIPALEETGHLCPVMALERLECADFRVQPSQRPLGGHPDGRCSIRTKIPQNSIRFPIGKSLLQAVTLERVGGGIEFPHSIPGSNPDCSSWVATQETVDAVVPQTGGIAFPGLIVVGLTGCGVVTIQACVSRADPEPSLCVLNDTANLSSQAFCFIFRVQVNRDEFPVFRVELNQSPAPRSQPKPLVAILEDGQYLAVVHGFFRLGCFLPPAAKSYRVRVLPIPQDLIQPSAFRTHPQVLPPVLEQGRNLAVLQTARGFGTVLKAHDLTGGSGASRCYQG